MCVCVCVCLVFLNKYGVPGRMLLYTISTKTVKSIALWNSLYFSILSKALWGSRINLAKNAL